MAKGKKGAIGGMLMNVHHGKMSEPKDTLNIHASYGPDYQAMEGPNSDNMHQMDVEEHARVGKKIKGIQGALDNWVPEDVAAQAHQSLSDELEHHKARHAELGARIKAHKAKKATKSKKYGGGPGTTQAPAEAESPAEDAGEMAEEA